MSPALLRLTAAGWLAAGLSLAPVTACLAQPAEPSQHSDPAEARFDGVRDVIRRTLSEANVPSIAVAVVQDGRIVFEEGFGLADRERGVQATAHTAYSIASMTKPITATAVMRLHEAGLLDLDAPIERYLGGLRLTAHAGPSDAATARRIMSHSAGLPQYGNFHLDGSAPADAEVTISRYGMVVFPPGSRFEYSNIGMRILDHAVAEVSGVTYAEFLRQEIFVPLGMRDSALGLPDGAVSAVRYDEDRQPMTMYMTDHPGSGDVWSSAHDMARFLAFHMGAPLPDQGPILSAESRLGMQRPASEHPMPTPPGAPRRDIGANWILTPVNGHLQVWHSGGQPGVSSIMAFYPELDWGFVILANASAPLGPIGQAIREAVAPQLVSTPGGSAPEERAAIPFRGRWVGEIVSHVGRQPIVLDIRADGVVTVQVADQEARPLVQPAFENGALTGRFEGVSPLPEARTGHTFALKVVFAQGDLVGQLVAQGISENAAFMLPGFVRLRPAGDGQ